MSNKPVLEEDFSLNDSEYRMRRLVERLQREELERQQAHYHHTLMDFKDIVRQYGVESVMQDMDNETFQILRTWYTKGDM